MSKYNLIVKLGDIILIGCEADYSSVGATQTLATDVAIQLGVVQTTPRRVVNCVLLLSEITRDDYIAERLGVGGGISGPCRELLGFPATEEHACQRPCNGMHPNAIQPIGTSKSPRLKTSRFFNAV